MGKVFVRKPKGKERLDKANKIQILQERHLNEKYLPIMTEIEIPFLIYIKNRYRYRGGQKNVYTFLENKKP